MSTTATAKPQVDLPRFVATITLLAAVMLIIVRNAGRGGRPPTGWLEDVAIAVVVLAPLTLAAVSHRWDPALRGGVMTGVGLLLVALGVLTMISIGFVFLLLGALMVVGGIAALGQERGSLRRFLASATVVLVTGVMAPVGAFLLMDPAPACWERQAGEPWRRIPVQGPGGDSGYFGGGVEGTCTSDTVTPAEMSLVVAPWAATASGLFLVGRRRAR